MDDSNAKPLVNAPRTPLEGLREAVLAAAAHMSGGASGPGSAGGAGGAGRGPAGVTLERPPRVEFGDYSTNAALLLAPGEGAPPREVAQRLGAELQERVGGDLERFEVAGPGFVNLFLGDAWHRRALAAVLEAGECFGAGGTARRERILVEFVSANPTGPMHVGHARNAAYGDALARVLALHGHEVTREFYVNDAGSQVRKLGESIAAWARGEAVPEDGYRGEYVGRLAQSVAEAATADPAQVGRAAVGVVVGEMQRSLQAFGVKAFDHWQYESELHEGTPSRVQRTLEKLEERGHTYRSEGAVWLRTTTYGDDKDRVVVRASGEHTYFASDIAYHEDKRERGFERQVDIWGADHHGYVARMKAAYEALGADPSHLEMVIMQLVHLVRGGERAQMSKRAGEFVTLEELVEEIGVDAARWFLLSRSHDTTIDLDLDLARRESSENPVYYVQYAHARIASVLAKAGEARVAEALAEVVAAAAAESREGAGGEPLHPSERALVKRLLAFPGEVWEAAQRRAPHRVAAYALELAQDFTAFYRDCRVVGAEPAAQESQRIAECVAARSTIARCLEDLLGVGAPQEM
jgi:arginyl-tRNA synthetase